MRRRTVSEGGSPEVRDLDGVACGGGADTRTTDMGHSVLRNSRRPLNTSAKRPLQKGVELRSQPPAGGLCWRLLSVLPSQLAPPI